MDRGDLSAIKAPSACTGGVEPGRLEQEEQQFNKESLNDAGEHKKKLELENAQLRIDHRREDLAGKTQDRKERKDYATKIFSLVVVWLWALAMIVLMDGARMIDLSDTVLGFLITGTTVDIIGLMTIVAMYLFPKNNGKQG